MFVLLGSVSFAKADDKKAFQRTMNFTLDTYVEALKSGYSVNYSSIISDYAKFNINRSGKLYTYGKAEELKSHGKDNIITQNCDITSTVITSSENYALVNVSMKYEFFTRENIVSLSKIRDSWKITEVNTIFK